MNEQNSADSLSEEKLFDEISKINNDLINTRRQLEKKNNEIELLNQKLIQSNQGYQDFAYSISHDLQEPLRMITGFISLLKEEYFTQLDEEALEYINFVVDGANRMKSMIDGMLEISRVGKNKKETFEIVSGIKVVEDAIINLTEIIEKRKAKINIDQLPNFYGNKYQIMLVFQNLITNAVKYNDKAIPRIDISGKEKGEMVEFSISDNGIGIEETFHETIFKMFKQLHTSEEGYGGIGLGLAISKRIVEHHGGEIWVKSILGEGATFYFTLPTKHK